MKCHSQESIPRVGGKGNQDRISIPCGKCPACLHNRREDWAFRLESELENATSANFITLTYADDQIKEVSKKHLQDFIRELRRQQVLKMKVSKYNTSKKVQHASSKTPQIVFKSNIRYYAVSEYGEKTGRPHYHLIVFNLNRQVLELVYDIWNKGFVHFGKVSEASIRYTLKYLMKSENEGNFILMSRRPGIGHNYLKKNFKWHRETKNDFALKPGGKKVKLPRYYKEKLFSIDERLNKTTQLISIQDTKDQEEYQRIKKLGNEPYYYDFLRKERFAQLLKQKRNKQNLL